MKQHNNQGAQWQAEAGSTILAQGVAVPYHDVRSGLNDNVLVVGGSGTGKTRSIVRPNLLQASGSYIVSDPKGNLYDLYARYLQARGYRVERLDFVQPLRSTVQYNLFHYLQSETDILRVAHLLNETRACKAADPFWEYSAEILLEAMIAFVLEARGEEQQTLAEVLRLIRTARRASGNDGTDSSLDRIMARYKEHHPESFAVKCYENVSLAPTRTWDSICVSATAKYGAFDTAELQELMAQDTVRIEEVGERPTAIFVVVSDTDRSMDTLASLFLAQTMQVLCRVADNRRGSRLAVPVRFILDDFATNVWIEEFPRMISSIRSRGISAMLMVQAESQLEVGYGKDARTIIANCDTYVYLGGNDAQTAGRIAERCNRTMLNVLNMPLHVAWVFRRGQQALQAETFDLQPFESARMEEAAGAMKRQRAPMTIGERRRRRVAAEERRRKRQEEIDWESLFDACEIEDVVEEDDDGEEVVS